MSSVASARRATARRPARRAVPPPPRRSRRRWFLAVAAAVVVLGAGVAGGLLARSSPDVALPLAVAPAAYHVEYTVTAPGAPMHRDVRDVVRPYDGRTLQLDASGQPTQGSLTNDSGSFLLLHGKWSRVTTGVRRAAGDEAALPALRAAVGRGLASARGTATVLGRRCTVVRTGKPVGSPIVAPSARDHADLCLDDQTGIILREVWTLRGRVAQTRTAVAFSTTAPAPNTFVATPAGEDLGVTMAGQSGVPHDTALPTSHLPALPVSFRPPAGYRLDAATLENTVAPSSGPQSVVIEHYVGPHGDLLDVEVGDVAPSGPGVPVSLPSGRSGQLTYDMTASQLVVAVGSAHVMLQGGDPELLVHAAAGIAATPTSG